MNEAYLPLLEAGTAVISDVFDTLGVLPPSLDVGLFPVTGPGTRFAGPTYTVCGESRTWRGGGDREKLAAIDGMPEGAVALWAGGDIRGVCCFGDLLATAMKARGVCGVVVDGGIRDSAFLATLGLPMLARYRTPSQAIGRWKVTGAQVPVKVRGALADWVAVAPGDIVVADEDGVIAVPEGMLAEVTARAAGWADKDSRAREAIARGMKLLEAIEQYGAL